MAFGLVPNPMTPSTVAEQGNVAIIFIIITWPFLFIRLYIRFWLKCPGPDDWLMIITQVLFTGYCVCNYEFIRLALTGEPQTVAEADQRTNWFMSLTLLYLAANITLKLSVGFFFLRLLAARWHRLVAYSAVTVVTLVNISQFCFVLFMCGNPKDNAARARQGRCVSWTTILAMTYLGSIPNIVVDVILTFLPIQAVWQLTQVSFWFKAQILGLLILAGSGTVCSILRASALTQISTQENAVFGTRGAIYSIAETGIFVLVGCLATMKPLVKMATSVLSRNRSAGFAGSRSKRETTETGSIPRSDILDEELAAQFNQTPALPDPSHGESGIC